jgi:hypothetical protein
LEIKLKEAEQQKERAEKQLAEKNSELIREKGEFVLKRNADSETIKRQQKELNGLRKYMETAEHHWDLLAENILGTYTRNFYLDEQFLVLNSNVYSCILMQNRLDILKGAGINFPGTMFFLLPEMTAKILSPPLGKYAIICL